MKNKIIYIGCPYSHEDKEVMQKRYEQITKLTAILVSEGYIVFSPITYGHILCEFEEMPVEFEFWQNLCISFLEISSLFIEVQLDGWELSKGLAAEYKFARDNDIDRMSFRSMNVEKILKDLSEYFGGK